VGMIPSSFVQDLQVVVDEDAALVCFSHCRRVLKIPPVRIDERQSSPARSLIMTVTISTPVAL
jgi:hypothetical protein